MRKLLLTLALTLSFALPSFGQDTGRLLEELKVARAAYPAAMSRPQVAELLNNFAYAHPGWGLLRKGAGNSCPLHDTNISCDILIFKSTIVHYDVLRDAENSAAPVWNSVGPCVLSDSSGCQMSNYLEPFAPEGSVVRPPDAVVPPVTPQPGVGVDPRVLEFMGAVAGALDSIQGKLDSILAKLETQSARLDGVQQALGIIIARPTVPGSSASVTFPIYKGSIFGQSFTLTPQGGK